LFSCWRTMQESLNFSNGASAATGSRSNEQASKKRKKISERSSGCSGWLEQVLHCIWSRISVSRAHSALASTTTNDVQRSETRVKNKSWMFKFKRTNVFRQADLHSTMTPTDHVF
jgi:hypothetical protein